MQEITLPNCGTFGAPAVFTVVDKFDCTDTGTPVVFLMDLDRPDTQSVTNAAEQVVAWACETYSNEVIIVYRDTGSCWLELEHKRGLFRGYSRWPAHLPPVAASIRHPRYIADG